MTGVGGHLFLLDYRADIVIYLSRAPASCMRFCFIFSPALFLKIAPGLAAVLARLESISSLLILIPLPLRLPLSRVYVAGGYQ